MKTIIATVLFIIFNLSLTAQVKHNMFIEAGYKDFRTSIYKPNQQVNNALISDLFKYNYYTNINYTLNYKNFKFEQKIENYMTTETRSFIPKQIVYTSSFSYKYKKFEIIGEHMCNHPIVDNQYNVENETYLRASYNKLTVKYVIF